MISEDGVYAEYKEAMDREYWRCPGCGRPADVGCHDLCME